MFENGLHTDTDRHVQPEGTYRLLLNGTLVEEEGVIVTEPGTRSIDSIPEGLKMIGEVNLGDNRTALLFTDGARSVIGVFDRVEFTRVFDDDTFADNNKLGLSLNYPCHVEIRTTKNGQKVLYWTDGLNPPRAANLSRLPTVDVEFNLNELKLFPEINQLPGIDLVAVESGGRLKSGSYQFAFAYVDEDATTTNFFHITAGIPIGRPTLNPALPYTQGLGSAPGTPTSKRIRFSIANLDPSYSRLRVAVLYHKQQENPDSYEDPEVYLLEDIIYRSDTAYGTVGTIPTMSFVHTGFEATTAGSIAEIIVPRPSYATAKALAQLDGVLYLGNLGGKTDDLGYQKYANAIQIQASTDTVPDYSFGDPVVCFQSRTFKSDEIYAFYISFILKDGTESRAYHIPGRAAVNMGTAGMENAALHSSSPFYAELNGNLTGVKNFHVTGTPYVNGFAYWENETELYPANSDSEIWTVDGSGVGSYTGSTLAGEKVRHYHFIDAKNLGYINGSNTNYKVFKIRLTNFKIPNEIRDRVLGWKISYARRSSGNRTILDQSYAHNLYSRSGDEDGDLHFAQNPIGAADNDGSDSYNDLLALWPFRLLRTKESIGNISFLKAAYSCLGEGLDVPSGHVGGMIPDTTVDVIRRVKNVTYVDANTPAVLFNYGGTDKIINNDHEEQKIVASLYNNPPSEGGYIMSYVWDIHAYIRDVYTSFSQQSLVSMGKYYPIPNLVTTTTDYIFGGDTVIYVNGSLQFSSEYTDPVVDDAGTPSVDETAPGFWYTVRQTDWWFYEGLDNPAFRYAGAGYWKQPIFKNANASYIIDNTFPQVYIDNTPQIPQLEKFVTWDGYNFAYSLLSVIKAPFPEQRVRFQGASYPNRVIRSSKIQEGIDIDAFRVFRDLDYYDIPSLRGPILVMRGTGDALIMHCPRGGFRTRGRDEIQVTDIRAYLGAGDIFSVSPQEFMTTDKGYAGTRDARAAIVTPSGYFFVDREAKKVFLLSQQLEEISGFGIEKELGEVLTPKLEKYGFAHNDFSIPYISVHAVEDTNLNRILLLVKDVTPNTSFLSANVLGNIRFKDGKFQLQSSLDVWINIEYDNDIYFYQITQVYCYLPSRKKWEGTKSYVPDNLFSALDRFYSIKGDVIHLHGGENTLPGKFYGTVYPVSIKLVQSGDPSIDKRVSSVLFDTLIVDPITGAEVHNETFTQVEVSNNYQTTDIIPLVPFPAEGYNTRRVKRVWSFSRIRDSEGEAPNDSGEPDIWYKRRLSGKFHEVLLIYSNVTSKLLKIFSIAIKEKVSIR